MFIFVLFCFQINIFILIFTLVASVVLGPVADVINRITNEVNNSNNAVTGETKEHYRDGRRHS